MYVAFVEMAPTWPLVDFEGNGQIRNRNHASEVSIYFGAGLAFRVLRPCLCVVKALRIQRRRFPFGSSFCPCVFVCVCVGCVCVCVSVCVCV